MSANERDGAREPAASRPAGQKSDRKGGLSCAECRRSKLRCDRAIPCSACVRRGCSAICPDGTLAATKGNKVLQSQNQALQQAVKSMNARIRELETALSQTHSQISPQPHPLLTESSKLPEVEAVASVLNEDGDTASDDVEEEAAELIGAMAIGENGQTRFHGLSSSSEYLQTLLPRHPGSKCVIFDSQYLRNLGLPDGIRELAYAFPFHCIDASPDAREVLFGCLPSHSKALELTLLYFSSVGYMTDVICQEEFVPYILHLVLEFTRGTPVTQNFHLHKLAVIFLVFAVGSAVSNDSGGKVAGQRYYALACAALSLQPLIREATSATLQALFIMVQYYKLVDRAISDRRWLMSGFMIRLAYAMGLQRDPAIWELSQEEVRLRRVLFWEMYAWDTWHSITLGRPPALDLRFTDCRFPEDTHPGTNEKGEKEWGFHAFRYRFAAFCLSQVTDHIFNPRQQDYSQLLQLDMKLRKFQIPSALVCPTSGDGEPVDGRAWSINSTEALQQYYCLCTRESILLFIHRRYFGGAIKLNRQEPMKTKYGASVLATIRSACLLVSALRSLHGKYPKLPMHQCTFWSGAFSACIVLGCLVFNSPSCSLSTQALAALADGVKLFSKPAKEEGNAGYYYSYDILVRLLEKSSQALEDFHRGAMPQDHSSDPECGTMRVLEGARVLIKESECSKHSSCGSTPAASTSSDSPGASAEHSTPLTETIPVPLDHAAPPGWTAERLPMPEFAVELTPDQRSMYDYAGVYYLPPSETDPVAEKPSPFSVFRTDVRTNGSPQHNGFSNGLANGLTGIPSAPPVISIPEYPTFSSANAPHQNYSQNGDVAMTSSIPEASVQTSSTNGHAVPEQTINLMDPGNLGDQASWDAFFREMGMAT